MDTEETTGNNHENSHGNVRIAVASILGTVGAGFISRLPLFIPGQEVIPWYQSGFFWAGIAIVVIALLVLIVMPKTWKILGQSLLGSPAWLRETYLWYRYGPRCTIETPLIDSELYPEEDLRTYRATVCLSVFVSEQTRNYLPIRWFIADTRCQLEQKHGLVPLHALLELNPFQSREFW